MWLWGSVHWDRSCRGCCPNAPRPSKSALQDAFTLQCIRLEIQPQSRANTKKHYFPFSGVQVDRDGPAHSLCHDSLLAADADLLVPCCLWTWRSNSDLQRGYKERLFPMLPNFSPVSAVGYEPYIQHSWQEPETPKLSTSCPGTCHGCRERWRSGYGPTTITHPCTITPKEMAAGPVCPSQLWHELL